MIDLYSNPATLAEISVVMGKSKRTVERLANRSEWKCTEENIPGKHNRRLYTLADLPSEILEAIERKRHDDYITQFHEEQQAKITGNESINPESGTEKAAANSPVPNRAMVPQDSESSRSHVSAKQRDHELAVMTIMRWIDEHSSGKKAKALRDLNERYHKGNLPSALKSALLRCKQKSSGKAVSNDILTRSTVEKWQARFKERGNYIPHVRSTDMTVKPWHLDLMEMIVNNKTKRPTSWMLEQLVEKYGLEEVTEKKVYYWISTKLSNMEIIKGQNTGMALKALQAYRRRSSAGMLPWDEIHADGWATHFTAPHPRTGEYVTFEVWDFHDVATRYVPPLSVGLSECFEVIAKGVENAVRDHGVMAHLQTDSTKIVKNNAKFSGDPITSIADVMGITIVHPVTVGNAQANGIAENFHKWLDMESRELATYQGKGMDNNTFRKVNRLTHKMVKAAAKGETGQYLLLKTEAESVSGGIVFTSTEEAIAWLESKRHKWNNKPHSSLKKVYDEKLKKIRHQSPQQALDEHKANGWKPYYVSEDVLVDVFRPKVKVKVRRGMVKPYGNMLFRHADLDAYEGDYVIVCYEHMDYRQVWVRNLKGHLICVAPLWEDSPYRSTTAQEAADERRALAQIGRREKQIESIRNRAGMDDNGLIIDSESRKVIEFALPEPTPQKQTLEDLFEPAPIESKKLTHAETMMLLWGQQDDEDDNTINNKPVSL